MADETLTQNNKLIIKEKICKRYPNFNIFVLKIT
jgi:hypothetical protein